MPLAVGQAGRRVGKISKSPNAGVEVLKAVAICKFMLVFIALAIVILAAEGINYFVKIEDKKVKFVADAVIIFIALVIALPVSLAIFDSKIKINVDLLETEFQES